MSSDLFDILKQIPAIPGYLLTAGQLIFWAVRGYRKWERRRRPPAKAVLEHRFRMREEIEKNLRRIDRRPDDPNSDSYFEEIIVRDIKRMDAFPKLDEKEIGVSPWLKLEVDDFYDRGIEVIFLTGARDAIPLTGPEHSFEGWRFLRDGETSDAAVHAIAIGRIPFDFIERIDWSRSDPYYGAPHFYVRYAGPLRMPYEETIYKAVLYPSVSRRLNELTGLKPDYADWSIVRRGAFLLSQDIRRIWLMLRGRRNRR